jgi:hypothetical protein
LLLQAALQRILYIQRHKLTKIQDYYRLLQTITDYYRLLLTEPANESKPKPKKQLENKTERNSAQTTAFLLSDRNSFTKI